MEKKKRNTLEHLKEKKILMYMRSAPDFLCATDFLPHAFKK